MCHVVIITNTILSDDRSRTGFIAEPICILVIKTENRNGFIPKTVPLLSWFPTTIT